jgi:hypothetical protein
MVFNETASSSSGTEVSKNNAQWIQNFELPNMVCCIVMQYKFDYFKLIKCVLKVLESLPPKF